jgi:endonuclease-3 related protein
LLRLPQFAVTRSETTFDDIYKRLMDRYGPQGWWPGRGRFEVAVGAVLTQGTAWTNAAKAIAALKQTRSHGPEGMARLSVAQLAARIRPAGFHNVKAERLKALTAWWMEHRAHRGFRSASTDAIRESLLGLNGIGPETADAILLYAFEKRVFVVDAYARRIFSRVGLIDGGETYERLRGRLERHFSGGVRECNEYHALIVQHGKSHCRTSPLCSGCCLASVCAHNRG